MSKKENLFRILIEIIATSILWTIILYIPKAEYDTNYALMLYGFILSVVITIFLLVYWIRKRRYWRYWLIDALIYILLSSPVTFGYVVLNIQEIFEIKLKT